MNNKKRKDGYLKTSFTIDGKRYYVYGKNSKELHEKELQKRAEIEECLKENSNPTVQEYFERRIEQRKDGISPNTFRNLRRAMISICKIWIECEKRKFGEILVKKVNFTDIYTLQQELAKTCMTNTVNGYMSKLHHVLGDAKRERIINYDPFELLTPLKHTEEKARDTYHRALTKEEQKKFFDSPLTKESNFYNVFRMAVTTGMRVGEIGALKFKDIKNDYINIERTITRVNGDAYGIGNSAKTAHSKRKIPLTDQIREILADQKRISYRAKKDNITDIEALIFVGPRGGLIMDQYVNEEIMKICEHEGIDVFTIHALRDTFATRAIEQGMQPRTLQEIMGHKDFSITMNLYCHVIEETKIAEMNKINIVI